MTDYNYEQSLFIYLDSLIKETKIEIKSKEVTIKGWEFTQQILKDGIAETHLSYDEISDLITKEKLERNKLKYRLIWLETELNDLNISK